MSRILLNPSDFSPVIEEAVNAAVRRLEANRPTDSAGRVLLTKRQAAESSGL